METSPSLIWQTLKETQPEYLSTLDPDFFCPFCSSLLTDPYNTPCGHNFCLNCFAKIIESGTKACPLDQQSFAGFSPPINKYLQKKVMQITLKCPNLAEGCKWQGTASELSGHFNECNEGAVLCQFGCGKKIKRKDLDEHWKENTHLDLNALLEENQKLRKNKKFLEEKIGIMQEK